MAKPPKSAAHRAALVRQINQHLGRRGIEATAARLTPLAGRADFIDISHALGVLQPFAGDDVRGYRRGLTIPAHIQRFMTLAYRTALTERIPVKLDIVTGPRESVQLDVTEKLMTITLVRPAAPAAGSTRASPRGRRKSA
jgi:hypothetical protein